MIEKKSSEKCKNFLPLADLDYYSNRQGIDWRVTHISRGKDSTRVALRISQDIRVEFCSEKNQICSNDV